MLCNVPSLLLIMGLRDRVPYNLDRRMKILGVCHGILGGLLMVFGVVARVAVDHWTSVLLLALWTGLMVRYLSFSY